MNNDFKIWIRETQKQGMKITKEKLIESIRRTDDQDFPFVTDPASRYILVRVPVVLIDHQCGIS